MGAGEEGGPAAPIGFFFLSGHILAKKHNIRVKTFDIRARGTNIRIKKLHYRVEPGLARPQTKLVLYAYANHGDLAAQLLLRILFINIYKV